MLRRRSQLQNHSFGVIMASYSGPDNSQISRSFSARASSVCTTYHSSTVVAFGPRELYMLDAANTFSTVEPKALHLHWIKATTDSCKACPHNRPNLSSFLLMSLDSFGGIGAVEERNRRLIPLLTDARGRHNVKILFHLC